MKLKKNLTYIYILGNSYSGSSLIGFVLGSSKKVFDAGEVKFFSRLKEKGGEKCSCGLNSMECNFWKKIYSKNFKIRQTFGFFNKLKIILRILLGIKIKGETECFDEVNFMNEINSVNGGELEYIVDTSKSIWRLEHLLRCKGAEVKVIYVKKNIQENVSSFVKHGVGFLGGTLIYTANTFLTKRFLDFNKVDFIELGYKKLCKDPASELKRLGVYLGLDYSDYEKNVRNREYHVPSGNLGSRSQFLSEFKGFRYDDSWKKRLTKLQLFVLDLTK